MLADLLIFAAASLGAFWLSSKGLTEKILIAKILYLRVKLIHFMAFLVMAGIWHVLFQLYGLYRSQRLNDRLHELKGILKVTFTGAGIYFLFGFFIKAAFTTPFFVLLFWLLSTFLTLFFRTLLRVFLKRIRLYGRNLRFILIVGTNQRAYDLACQIKSKKELGYRVVGFVDEDVHSNNENINLLGTLKDFPTIIKDHIIDEIIITLPIKSCYEEIQTVVRMSEEQGIKIRYLSDFFKSNSVRSNAQKADLSFITTISGPQEDWYFLAKRIMDIIFSALLLVVTSPLMVVAALGIKLTSPGPVFYKQTRIGLNKRHFNLIKFRTMVENAEKLQTKYEHMNEMDGPVFKITNDPRVTQIGSWLRKTSIDELPQLFNVLKGDMSLVGPRPLPIRDYNGFDEDWQRKRFTVLPGITCIWQISGRNQVSFKEWMKMDMEYIENWSLLNDFLILLKTIPSVIRGRGAV